MLIIRRYRASLIKYNTNDHYVWMFNSKNVIIIVKKMIIMQINSVSLHYQNFFCVNTESMVDQHFSSFRVVVQNSLFASNEFAEID